jgi:hypothetical protein
LASDAEHFKNDILGTIAVLGGFMVVILSRSVALPDWLVSRVDAFAADEEGRPHLSIHLPIEHDDENRWCLWRPDKQALIRDRSLRVRWWRSRKPEVIAARGGNGKMTDPVRSDKTWESKVASDPPKVFISYSHDSEQHEQHVRALADQLREDGIEAWIDQYLQDPEAGWIKSMRTQVKEAEKVLLVFTETYQRRFEGDEEQRKGLGATFEGVIVAQSLYESGGQNAKFRPVVFQEEDLQFIPVELRRFNYCRVDTREHYQNLLRWLYGEPRIIPPALWQKLNLPPEPGSRLFPGLDKSLSQKAHDSVCENEAPNGTIRWEKALGYTYDGQPPTIMSQGIQLSGTNISGEPIRIEAARLNSKISHESVEVDIGTVLVQREWPF